MRRGFANRVDTTAKALVAHAKTLGFKWLPSDGTIDGTLWLPSTGLILPTDWKAPDGLMTPAQQRLVFEKWPIEFISSVDQLEQLARSR